MTNPRSRHIMPVTALERDRADVEYIRRNRRHFLSLRSAGASHSANGAIPPPDVVTARDDRAVSARSAFSFDFDGARMVREAHDYIQTAARFRLSIDPGDNCIRTFYLRGTHAEVMRRAFALFESPAVLICEPLADGAESIDKRLNVITKREKER
jgi:hypothetical protein